MICFPNAKINLGLLITEKRADGYHNLESIFAPINWFDALEIVENKSEEFYLNGQLQSPEDRSNLVLKAVDALRTDYYIPNLKIYLEKNIPIGAGLGGGSADASFALTLVNDIFGLNIPKEELKKYASLLGSDCPFFVENKLCYATEKGNKLETLIKPNLSKTKVVLVNPNIHISTKEAYEGIAPKESEVDLRTIIQSPIKSWSNLGLKNDFEICIFKKYPEIQSIKEKLYALGASYACMSGSGSTVLGIFEDSFPKTTVFKEFKCHFGEII